MTELLKLLHLVALGDVIPKDAEAQIRAAVAIGGVGRLPVTVGTPSGSFTATIYEIPARGGIVEPYDVRPRGVGSDGG